MRSLSASFLSIAFYLVACNAASLAPRAPRAISVASITELGAIRQNSNVVGRDNGQSAGVNGKSYWFFDDTTMKDALYAVFSLTLARTGNTDHNLPDAVSISNTAAVTTDLDASNNIDLTSSTWTNTDSSSRPGYLIPLTDAEVQWQNTHAKDGSGNCKAGANDPFCNAQYALWPGAVFPDPARNRIIVAYGKLCRVSSGSKCNGGLGQGLGWGFYQVNLSLGLGAKMNPSTGGITDDTGVKDPALFGGANTNGFTGGAVVSGGNVYLYGGGDVFTGVYLAKAPIDDFENMSKWTYWDGSSYQGDKTKLKGTIAPGAAGNTVFYSSALGGFYNAYMPYGSNTMFMQSAPAPEGPWSSAVKLFDSVPSGGSTNYAAYAHPEYSSADGLTHYMSYFQTGTGAQRLTKVVLK